MRYFCGLGHGEGSLLTKLQGEWQAWIAYAWAVNWGHQWKWQNWRWKESLQYAAILLSDSDANKDQSWMWGQKKWTFGGKIWNEALFLRDNGKSLLKEGTDDQKGRTKKRDVTRGKRWFLGAMGRCHKQHCAKCSWAKSQSGLEILLEVQCYFRPPSSE